MFKRAFYAFDVFQSGKTLEIGVGNVVIFQGIGGVGDVVEALFPLGGEQQHPFAATEMAVKNVRQIQVVVQKGF